MGRKKAATAAAAADNEVRIKSIKGFDADLACAPGGTKFQFEVGKTYTVSGKIKACTNGFHAVDPANPLHVWDFHPPVQPDGRMTRYAEVEQFGETDCEVTDAGTKIASASITIAAELSLPQFLERGIAALLADLKDAPNTDIASGYGSTQAASGNGSTQAASGNFSTQAASGSYSTQAASGNGSTQAASGYYSTQAASGNGSKQAASGDRSTQAASGNGSKQAASGNFSTQVASGDYSKQAASGDYSKQAASGSYSTQAASGDYSKQAASGSYSTQAASGNGSKQAASGYYSTQAASGNGSTQAASGDRSTFSITGKNGIIACAGNGGRVAADTAVGTWIALAEYDDAGKCIGFATGCIGLNGLEAGHVYVAKGGKLVKAEEAA